ncbi:MAG: hypothetical protein J6Q30_02135 [Oscillospiraceae bacterium]|nr:hypothetical protein [Oscillospiraceae bacterium]
MKLRISSCKTAFTKDLTRFTPVWGLYLVGILLALLPGLVGDEPATVGDTLGRSLGGLAVLNLAYAALCAQLLFGDLFRSRLCNALHALPLKRSDWFFCHVGAGFAFSLVPNTICALLVMPLLGQYWFVSLLWLAVMMLEFLFFFGLAVLSMVLVGNRFAMVAVYGILNFLSMLILWVIQTVVKPLLLGFYISGDWFQRFSPVIWLNNEQKYICFDWVSHAKVFAGLGDGWLYLLILGGVGLLLGGLALLLYRRRALETAGDFIAFKPLAPIFCVVYTLTVTALFGALGDLFFGELMIFLPVGFLVGYFTAKMLLGRTIKVFKAKVLLRFGIFAAVVAACVALIAWDPVGYRTWTPEPSQVASVRISNSVDVVLAMNGGMEWRESIELDDPEDIAAIVNLHREVTQKQGEFPDQSVTSLQLCYTLQNGRQVTRVYEYCVPAAPLAEFFSRPEYVLGFTGEKEAYLASVSLVALENGKLIGKDARALLSAIIADCEAGTMAQSGIYHNDGSKYVTWVEFKTKDGRYNSLAIYANAENTVAWLKENFSLWADENSKPEDYFQN